MTVGILFLMALCVYLSALLGFALLTYAFFWYETFNGPHLDRLRQRSQNRVAGWILRGIVTSFVSQNLTVLCYPLRFWRKLWEPHPDTSCPHPPIILIHGLFHNVSAWILYRYVLRRNGFRNIYAFGYGSLNTSFQEILNKLDRKVQAVGRVFPGQRLVLIGHSLGGLLVRAYAEDPHNTHRIAAAVTLGAPHQGSKLAALGSLKLARSLCYRGKLLAALEPEDEPPDIPRLAVYSPIDNMVLPNESCQVAHAGWTHQECQPLSHLAMLYHVPLVRLVSDYLQRHASAQLQERAGD
ncbi:esterase/lipase family protein [Desulfoferrobacter suflitae]|uniref:esterase/lipase family protein n=1 Tax=Desulfoferrobacter suflitae TaxID=2865782 RepID=UPI002164398B|nr:alpha/beta fold hydrolase [Desulfoferrobacter suflitae]MCK8602306.1 alpha/beta fold hydrolase [Desulfoferrobacter suflitae]